ncbi:hypothetical protein [Streptomyces sp. NPDC056948]|uniref:hypothetical protein n=1 Tax=Streptomyces sp. NPDC056948 TaxID=3345975 RepID=UPI0036334D63
MTVTTTDDKVSPWLEVRAPPASRRLRTLTELHAADLPAFAFAVPLPRSTAPRGRIPHCTHRIVKIPLPELRSALVQHAA